MEDAAKEILHIGLEILKTISGDVVYKIILTILKSDLPKLISLFKIKDELDNSETCYYKFKESLWKYLNSEKMSLTTHQFDNKFMLVKYFVDEKKY